MYVVHAGVELTEVSVPHTMYEPGVAPLGGAADGVALVQLPPVPAGAAPVAQLLVLPKDHTTCA